MRLNALWWWIDRWRKSTAYTDMTLEEQGAYRNLLDEANLRGGAIPNDERILGKACGDAMAWPCVRDNVLSRFELRADGWHNVTLDKVIDHYTKRAEKQAAYRERIGNTMGNADGNNAGNTTGSPISDLRSPISVPKDPPAKEPPDPRVKTFLTWFQDEYKTRRHGATYFVNWKKDAAIVKRLLCAYELERLKMLATILLLCDDPWIAGTDRSVGILATKINWLEDWERTWTAKHQSAS